MLWQVTECWYINRCIYLVLLFFFFFGLLNALYEMKRHDTGLLLFLWKCFCASVSLVWSWSAYHFECSFSGQLLFLKMPNKGNNWLNVGSLSLFDLGFFCHPNSLATRISGYLSKHFLLFMPLSSMAVSQFRVCTLRTECPLSEGSVPSRTQPRRRDQTQMKNPMQI